MLRKSALLTLALASSTAMAAMPEQYVVSPHCLLEKLTTPAQTLARDGNFALVKINEAQLEQLSDVKHTTKHCGGFMNVSQQWMQSATKKIPAATFLSSHVKPKKSALAASLTTYEIKYSTQVNALLNSMNMQDMWNDLASLSGFHDRYANSDNGVNAAMWIKKQVEDMAAANHRSDVTAYTVETGTGFWSWKQPSVVVKIGNGNEAGVVVGGHMDTTSGTFSVKPGADDDGTGSATVLEVARTLLSSGMQFKHPIYLVWYSAEEAGLIGSGYVVEDFKKKNIPVSAVMQLDMTGYAYKNDPTMWLVTDYVDSSLTNYLEKLINTYVKQPVKRTRCGYACSDHATWYQNGFASSIPFESSFETDNPNIHSANDTMDKLSINHMTSFAKTAVAFAVELAEPTA